MSAASDNISSRYSPITPTSSNGDRRPDIYPTRRLSQAIDTLRRDCEAVLWELNSLKTQNSVLEQRILDQAGELDTINRSLSALREQHIVVEHQYKDKLIALRSELRTLHDEQSTSAPTLAREPRQSPSPPDWSRLLWEQRNSQRPRPQSPLAVSVHVPVVPLGLRAHARNAPTRDNSAETSHTTPPRPHSAILPHSPYTLPPLRHAESHTSTTHPSYSAQPQPRLGPSGHTRIHHSHRPPRPLTSPASHDPSLSPTATLVGSDAPSRPRSRKG